MTIPEIHDWYVRELYSLELNLEREFISAEQFEEDKRNLRHKYLQLLEEKGYK